MERKRVDINKMAKDAVVEKLETNGFKISNQDWYKRGKNIIANKDSRSFNIKVHAKRDSDWPNCKGVSGSNSILILVDYRRIGRFGKPDFYILSEGEWISTVHTVVGDRIKRGTIEINEDNVPVWLDQPLKTGKGFYSGMGLKNRDVASHKEKWEKLLSV